MGSVLAQARKDLPLGSSVSNLSVEKSALNHQFPPCLMEQKVLQINRGALNCHCGIKEF